MFDFDHIYTHKGSPSSYYFPLPFSQICFDKMLQLMMCPADIERRGAWDTKMVLLTSVYHQPQPGDEKEVEEGQGGGYEWMVPSETTVKGWVGTVAGWVTSWFAGKK